SWSVIIMNCKRASFFRRYSVSSYRKRIGVLTGGGDAPGLNAVIRAVVKTATKIYGWEVIGIEDGFEGLMGETRTRPRNLENVRGLLPRGGTILGSVNRGRFATRVDEVGKQVKDEAAYS